MLSLNKNNSYTPSPLEREDGFSIVEGLITMGILVMVMTLSLQLLNTSDRGWHSILRNQEQNALAEEVRVTFTNEDICMKNFGGKSISVTAPNNTVTTTELNSYDPDGNKGSTLMTVGQQRGSLIPTNITLRAIAEVSPGNLLADLTLSTQMVGAPTNRVTQRNITMSLTVASGLISNCSTGLSYESKLEEKSCSIGSNGAKRWDPELQACISATPATIVLGTPFLATCPAGTVLSGATSSCWHGDLPPGYEDTYPPITRTYDDGTTITRPPAVGVCRPIDTTNCECEYANGVDPNIFQARIECIASS